MTMFLVGGATSIYAGSEGLGHAHSQSIVALGASNRCSCYHKLDACALHLIEFRLQ
jgi:hypothetical protein